MRQLRPLDVELEIAVEVGSDRNVGERWLLARERRLPRQQPVEPLKQLAAAPHVARDQRGIALRRGGAESSHEYPVDERRLQRRLRPIHPAVNLRAFGGILAPES